MLKPRVLLLLVMVGALSAALLSAQRGGRFRSAGNPGTLLLKEDPTTEFAIARWFSPNWQGDGWYHDYPQSEEHILQIMHEVSLIETNRDSYKVIDISSKDIFKYPFAYVSHPGDIVPSDEEIDNIREYIERGGFMMLDDFGGQGQGPEEMGQFTDMLRRIAPDRQMYLLKDNHELLRISYQIDSLEMLHPMSDAKSIFYGFNDSEGRLAMVICYANDIGDYWEFIDEPRYKVKPSAEALKIGVNIALYSMTH